jgi:hypothetical protein
LLREGEAEAVAELALVDGPPARVFELEPRATDLVEHLLNALEAALTGVERPALQLRGLAEDGGVDHLAVGLEEREGEQLVVVQRPRLGRQAEDFGVEVRRHGSPAPADVRDVATSGSLAQRPMASGTLTLRWT